MIVIPEQSDLAWRATLTAFHVIALLFTSFRVVYHARIRHLWWDDYVVIVAQIVDIYYCVIVWFDWLSFYWDGNPAHFPAVNLWITAIPCYILLWTTRMALALSFGKIFSPTHIYRKISYIMTGAFAVCCMTIVLTTMFLCPGAHGGTRIQMDVCQARYDALGLFIRTSDFLGDILLVALPFHALWRVKLPPFQRRLILSLFSASLMTLLGVVFIVVLLYGPFQMTFGYLRVTMFIGHVASITSLIVANLLVVGSFLYRTIHNHDASKAESPVEPERAQHLTHHSPTTIGNTGNSLSASHSLVTSTYPSTSPSSVTYLSELTRISGPSVTFGSFVPSRGSSQQTSQGRTLL